MSHVNVIRQHSLGVKIAQTKVQAIEPMLQERFGITLLWQGSHTPTQPYFHADNADNAEQALAEIKGRGVQGNIAVNKTSISMTLKLGLLLRPLASKIQRKVEHTLDQELSA